MSEEKWQESSTLTNGEVTEVIAKILNCQPNEVRGWIVIGHIHPDDGPVHAARMATNIPPELISHLILEGLGTL